MQTIIYQIVPNEWVTDDLLTAATGIRPGTIRRARKESWMLGREYKHVSPSGIPSANNECLYHIPSINRWIKNQPDPVV
ncbi:excisionase family protein [Salmonella enterica]|nr:excisionase [Salmonella enterica]EBU8672099.1 excisionase [Salmonella enterica subsp. enterica serovar Panama]EBW7251483.1 excisionase [Salmonella enterica subsp. enterica serovar Gatow]ECF2799487.1 excisionase [Salmonella enterica subsp. enterica serovar Miami]EDW0701357.1 excisionase family protein [Salmonella enterica subsp. enterica]HCM6303637.1 excisionase family protein [Salmonella enterica subsp. enterica serovar 6,14:y:1,7]